MKKYRVGCGVLLCGMLAVLGACTTEKEVQTPTVVKKMNTKKTVRITVSGDVLIEAPNYDTMQENYSFGAYFDEIKPYLKGDLVIGNQEVPLGGEELGIAGADYQFNAPAAIAPQLKNLGFDVMTFSNNHSYDRGMTGIANTISNMNNAGLETTGSFTSQEDRNQTLVVERNGVKIAILAYTYDTNQYIPEEENFAVNKFLNANHEFDEAHKTLIRQDVEAAKEQADAVIVAMHWGTEFTYELNPQQIAAAQYLNELGVDLIIGNHPHTLQSVDTLTNTQGKQTFVIYSLGNFVSGSANVDRASEQFTNMYEIGGIVQMDMVFDVKKKTVSIEHAKMIPIVNHISYGYENFKLLPFKNYNEEIAQQHYQRSFSSNFTYAYLNNQLHQLFDNKIPWNE